jgi:hypothetical protein
MKIGDSIKKLTDALGIPQCDECKERQRKLNEFSDWIGKIINEPLGLSANGRSDADRSDGSGEGSRAQKKEAGTS